MALSLMQAGLIRMLLALTFPLVLPKKVDPAVVVPTSLQII
jgi:hypothetical protein